MNTDSLEHAATSWNAGRWESELRHNTDYIQSAMLAIYGSMNEGLLAARRELYARVAEVAETLGSTPCCVIRCPARINLMGMHVEHQGGAENPICIPREHVALAAARDDDCLVVDNVDPRFGTRRIELDALASSSLRTKSWREYCREVANIPAGDWGSYVHGAAAQVVRLSEGRHWRGVHIVLGSDIPLAAGLSSSAALVLIVIEALRIFNHVTLSDEHLVTMAGAAELIGGTLGGDGDGSAMVNARPGACVHHRFFPYRACTYRLPPDLSIVLADSCTTARKQNEAKDTFNERITCYRLGRLICRAELSTAGRGLEHLGDLIDMFDDADILRLLKKVPTVLTRREAYDLFHRDCRAELDYIFESHREPPHGYRVRARVLFGLAEMRRAVAFKAASERGDSVELGRLKTTGHNGDRVVWPAGPSYSNDDAYLDRLIQDGVDLARVNGAYECSTPQLDALVDAALEIDGVFGAGLTGAGMGGSIIVLCHHEHVHKVIGQLHQSYYRSRSLPTDRVQLVCPIRGMSVMSTECDDMSRS